MKYLIKTDDISSLEEVDYGRVIYDTTTKKVVIQNFESTTPPPEITTPSYDDDKTYFLMSKDCTEGKTIAEMFENVYLVRSGRTYSYSTLISNGSRDPKIVENMFSSDGGPVIEDERGTFVISSGGTCVMEIINNG